MRIEHYMNMRNRNRNYFIRKVTCGRLIKVLVLVYFGGEASSLILTCNRGPRSGFSTKALLNTPSDDGAKRT